MDDAARIGAMTAEIMSRSPEAVAAVLAALIAEGERLAAENIGLCAEVDWLNDIVDVACDCYGTVGEHGYIEPEEELVAAVAAEVTRRAAAL